MKHVYPVIHHLDLELTRTEATVAFNAGADGVFLISHHGDDTDLLGIAHEIKQQYLTKKVGLNLLGFDCVKAYHLCYGLGLDMMWTDFAGIDSTGYTGELGENLQRAHWNTDFGLEVFASVAFKYQKAEPNPAGAAKVARDLGYIATTSGPGTGQAPDVSKIVAMIDHLTMGIDGSLDLAIASGMTPENVHLFTPYVSHFLVSTGISKDEYRLDPYKVKQFCEIVHAASGT